MIIIGIFFMILLFLGMVGTAYYFVKKSDPERLDTTNSTKMQSAQDFMPWVDIKDQMISMGDHVYHAILEVSSVNYELRNDREKDIIEMSFQNLLNSLTHPVTFFVSTREMDYTKLLESMKEDYEKTYHEFPEMREYLQQNLLDMKNLSQNMGETRHKRKYIIVPYDAKVLTELDDEEKYDAAAETLYERVVGVQGGLNRISGLDSKILDTVDIIDLLIQTYHRDGSRYAEDIFNGSLTSMLIDGEDTAKPTHFTEEEKFDIFLNEMQAQLESGFLHNGNMTTEMKKKAHDMWGRIHSIRQSDDLEGLKVNHQRERERAFEEKIQNGEVTFFGTNSGHQDTESTKEGDGGERL